MSLKFSTSGRPMIECINQDCQRLHSIYRRGDYIKRAQTRIVCRNCGTKWNLKDEDAKALQEHYEQRQMELEAKKREKLQKNQEKIQKSDEIKEHTEPTKTQKEPTKTRKTPSKKGFLDEIFSL